MGKEKQTVVFRRVLYLKSVIDQRWFDRYLDITPEEKKDLEQQGIVFPKKPEPKKVETPTPKPNEK